MTIYDGYQTWEPGRFPAMLAIGDSWFWYPANNLLEALAAHEDLKDGYQHMVRLGQNGALLSDYVDVPGRPGRFADKLNELLRPDPMQYITVFLVSGAGNDAVDYGLGLEDDCSGATTPEECVSKDGMHALIGEMTKAMSLLIHEVLWAFGAEQRMPIVVLHGYDYAVPDNRGFGPSDAPLAGPWLAPAMNARAVPQDLDLRKGIVRMLIDRVNEAFGQYARPGSGIYFVDSRGCLRSGAGYKADWANELHPTRRGFDRIVDQRWMPLLRGLGIAKS